MEEMGLAKAVNSPGRETRSVRDTASSVRTSVVTSTTRDSLYKYEAENASGARGLDSERRQF